MQTEVKVIRADRVEAIQSSPGCYRRGIFEKDTDSSLLIEVIFEAGKRCGMHKHSVEECFFVLRGHGKAIINGKEYELDPDMCLYCPAEAPHAFINTRDCESLVMLATFSKHKDEFESTAV